MDSQSDPTTVTDDQRPGSPDEENGAPSAAPPESTRASGLFGKFGLSRIPSGARVPILVYGWAQFVLLVWWAGQYPGLLTTDSVRYVLHVTHGPWTADHSVLYDATVLASLKLTENVALLTLVQATAFAATLGYAVYAMAAFGVRRRWAVIPGIVLPLLPSFGTFVDTVWKDVPFALCEVLVTLTTLRIVTIRRQAGADSSLPRRQLFALGAEFIGLVLFRNDGFVMLTVATVVLVILLRGLRLRILALSVGAILVMLGAQKVVYPAVGIQPASSSLTYGIFYADIALDYSQAPATYTRADTALMAKVAPLSTWRKANNCYTSDTLFNKTFDRSAADRLHSQLFRLWLKVVARRPLNILADRLCRGSVAWNPLPAPTNKSRPTVGVIKEPRSLHGSLRHVPTNIGHNITMHPLSVKLGRFTLYLREKSGAANVQSLIGPLIWRAAAWCYLAYLVLAVAARRFRRWEILAVGAMVVSHQLTVTFLNPAQFFRYMAGPLFIGMILVPLLAARPASADVPPGGNATEPDSDRGGDDEAAECAPAAGEAPASGPSGRSSSGGS